MSLKLTNLNFTYFLFLVCQYKCLNTSKWVKTASIKLLVYTTKKVYKKASSINISVFFTNNVPPCFTCEWPGSHIIHWPRKQCHANKPWLLCVVSSECCVHDYACFTNMPIIETVVVVRAEVRQLILTATWRNAH